MKQKLSQQSQTNNHLSSSSSSTSFSSSSSSLERTTAAILSAPQHKLHPQWIAARLSEVEDSIRIDTPDNPSEGTVDISLLMNKKKKQATIQHGQKKRKHKHHKPDKKSFGIRSAVTDSDENITNSETTDDFPSTTSSDVESDEESEEDESEDNEEDDDDWEDGAADSSASISSSSEESEEESEEEEEFDSTDSSDEDKKDIPKPKRLLPLKKRKIRLSNARKILAFGAAYTEENSDDDDDDEDDDEAALALRHLSVSERISFLRWSCAVAIIQCLFPDNDEWAIDPQAPTSIPVIFTESQKSHGSPNTVQVNNTENIPTDQITTQNESVSSIAHFSIPPESAPNLFPYDRAHDYIQKAAVKLSYLQNYGLTSKHFHNRAPSSDIISLSHSGDQNRIYANFLSVLHISLSTIKQIIESDTIGSRATIPRVMWCRFTEWDATEMDTTQILSRVAVGLLSQLAAGVDNVSIDEFSNTISFPTYPSEDLHNLSSVYASSMHKQPLCLPSQPVIPYTYNAPAAVVSEEVQLTATPLIRFGKEDFFYRSDWLTSSSEQTCNNYSGPAQNKVEFHLTLGEHDHADQVSSFHIYQTNHDSSSSHIMESSQNDSLELDKTNNCSSAVSDNSPSGEFSSKSHSLNYSTISDALERKFPQQKVIFLTSDVTFPNHIGFFPSSITKSYFFLTSLKDTFSDLLRSSFVSSRFYYFIDPPTFHTIFLQHRLAENIHASEDHSSYKQQVYHLSQPLLPLSPTSYNYPFPSLPVTTGVYWSSQNTEADSKDNVNVNDFNNTNNETPNISTQTSAKKMFDQNALSVNESQEYMTSSTSSLHNPRRSVVVTTYQSYLLKAI